MDLSKSIIKSNEITITIESKLFCQGEFIFEKIYEDVKNKFQLLLICTNNNISILKIPNDHFNLSDVKSNIVCSFRNVKLSNISSLSYITFLNKLYIVNNLSSIYMIDIDSQILHDIVIEVDTNLSDNLDYKNELFENNGFDLIGSKIIITGGINKLNKLNDSMISFDISNYKFEKEKIRENNIIPRHSHGLKAHLGFLYLIGGFTTVDLIDSKICDSIQVIKFDNLLNQWMDLKTEGHKPKLLIKPKISFIRNEFIIVFSDYKYPKIWYLNLNTNAGFLLDLVTDMSTNSIVNKSKFILSISEKSNDSGLNVNIISRSIQDSQDNEDSLISSNFTLNI